jgi:DNA-directed RNA polymerase subunit F
VLENNAITYRENQNIIEQIGINQIIIIKRTFNDYYRKEQNIDPDHMFRILINRIFSLVKYIILIPNKVIFHILKNHLSAYKFFDSILVCANDNKIINILPTNNIEYQNIREYFLERKNIDILSTQIIIKFDYRQEEKMK